MDDRLTGAEEALKHVVAPHVTPRHNEESNEKVQQVNRWKERWIKYFNRIAEDIILEEERAEVLRLTPPTDVQLITEPVKGKKK